MEKEEVARDWKIMTVSFDKSILKAFHSWELYNFFLHIKATYAIELMVFKG